MTAQAWILELSAKGVGVRRVAQLAGVSTQTVQRAKAGQALKPSTAARILEVRPSLAHGARVNSYQTRRLWRLLRREGFAEAQLCGLLGLRCRRMQWDDQFVSVRKALRVRALYRRLTEA